MALPLSLKQTYFSLGKFLFQNILKDDYPHKKIEAETYKATTEKNSSINYKTECIRKNQNGKFGLELKDELKFGYQFAKRHYLQTRIKRDGEIKYHLDLGNFLYKANEYNLFGAVKTDTNLSKFWTRVGMGILRKYGLVAFRLEKKYNGEYDMSSMGYFNYKPFYISFNQIKNLETKKTTKLDFSVNMNKNNLDVTFQHLSIPDAQLPIPIGKILLGLAYKFNKQIALAAWYKKNLKTKKERCVVGIQCQKNDKLLLKCKTDCKGKTSLSSKYNLMKNMAVNVGAQVNVVELLRQPEKRCLNAIPFGYSLDINI